MIYVFQVLNDGPIKIGYTIDTTGMLRFKALQVALPYDLKVVRLLDGDRSAEIAIHKKFREFKIRAEWYKPSEELLRFVLSDEIEKFIQEKKYHLTPSDAAKLYKNSKQGT